MAGLSAVNVDLGSILKNADSVGSGIKSVLGGIRELIKGKEVDPNKLVEMEATLAQIDSLQQTNQTDINKIEAQHSSIWVAGWRPYIGWICGTAIGVYFLPIFIIGTYLWARQVILTNQWINPPDLGIGQVIALVASMLGFGVYRTLEKKWKVQGEH